MAITLKVPANRNDHFIGSLDAPVIMVEYGDLECLHTYRARDTADKLIREFREGLCFVFRHFPMVEKNANAAMAALATEAAAKQGQFWKMHRHLLDHHHELSANFIINSASDLGLNKNEFMQEMENEDHLRKIQMDLNSGKESGVLENTPSFFINGIMLEYPTNYELLRHEIVSLLHEDQISP
jgi:protein-disulfide isomerase